MTKKPIIDALRLLNVAFRLQLVEKYTIVVESEEDRRKIEHALIQEIGGSRYLTPPTAEEMRKGRQSITVMGVDIVTKWDM